MLELIKDIQLPGEYYRAGQQKTRGEWAALFPHLHFQSEWDRWFIDLDKPNDAPQDEIREIVEQIFNERLLYSISYKEAAVECVTRYAAIKKAETN